MPFPSIYKNETSKLKCSILPAFIVLPVFTLAFFFWLYSLFSVIMKSTFFLACLVFLSGACGSVSAGHLKHRRHHARSSSVSAAEKLNTPSSGTPTSDFAASANLPAAKLAAAAKKAKKAGQKYQISQGSKTYSTIFTDWANFKNVSL